jgi:hypothetical protein
MPTIFKFRIYWEEDDLIYRDIAIISNQTLFNLHEAITKAYDFDGKHSSVIYESNDRWDRLRAFDSEVQSNKKDALFLSMVKTPLSALIHTPEKKFIYTYDPEKNWTFLVELIGITSEYDENKSYPYCIRKEGMAPSQYKLNGPNGMLIDIEEKYDLGKDDMDEGYGDEGENEQSSEEDENYDDSQNLDF